MEAAIKVRRAARGWATRAMKALNALCESAVYEKTSLSDAIDEFDKRIGALDEAQTQVELELAEEELDADIENAANLRERLRDPRVRASKLLADLLAKDDKEVGKQSSHLSGSRCSLDVRLPKLELPEFSGNITEWQSFWDQFRATVDDSDLPDITKFTYLRSLLRGEAKAAIHGLSLTSAHYSIACDILQSRFGRKERIIFTHIQELLNVSIPCKQASVAQLWNLFDELQAHIRSLESLGILGEQYGVILTPLILSRLPQNIRLEWAREGEGHESDLGWLLEFLQREIKRRERSLSFREFEGEMTFNCTESVGRMSTVSALNTTSDGCGFCSKGHATERCRSIAGLPVTERKRKIMAAGLCFCCLGKGHLARTCSVRCSQCREKHHPILCGMDDNRQLVEGSGTPLVSGTEKSLPLTANPPTEIAHVEVACNGEIKNVGRVFLQTARVNIQGKRGPVTATVLFDTGADRSYISSALVKKVKPEWVHSQPLAYAAFGASSPSTSTVRDVFQVSMKGLGGDDLRVQVTEVPVICAPMFRTRIPEGLLGSLGDIQLADCYDQDQNLNVDLLIGLDNYWQLVLPNMLQIPQGLVAQETKVGWIVSGTLVPLTPHDPRPEVTHQMLCFNDLTEQTFQAFWDLESLGIRPDESPLVDPILDKFQSSVCYTEGRYEVSLPWKEPCRRLLNNEKLARKRLEGLTRRLSRNPDLQNQYSAVIQDMVDSSIVEEVPMGEVNISPVIYYMPHRPVVREDKVSSKVRPVFDASAPGYNGVSLNDCLHSGPSMIPNLVEILIRFRRWKVALTADISKAFLQIRVRKEDQDVHRFLWNDKGQIRVMRFRRVPFGNKSSPFLLNATIQHHLSNFPPGKVVLEMQSNFYVDDWLSGADDDMEAVRMLIEATDIMSQAGMALAKWGSNSEVVSEKLYREFEGKHVDPDSTKVLGLNWQPKLDCFSFSTLDFPNGLCVTKRVVLSFIARLFDPVGFLAPFIMCAKILFQELWKLGLEWDTEVPSSMGQRFLRWVTGLQHLSQWQIPRSYSGCPWKDIQEVELHAFGDASESGYGACVYLGTIMKDGSRCFSLVTSKAKVAPIKRPSLPRLELLGSLLCARLLCFVRKALQLNSDVTCHCWSDSLVTLAWINSEPSKWKTFVGNRVAQIQELTEPSQWGHCPGKENPADLLTRGIHAEELTRSQLWLNGPQFLWEGLKEEKTSPETTGLEDTLATELSLVVTTKMGEPNELLFDVERWSCLVKGTRVIAWVLRFINNISHTHTQHTGPLSVDEFNKAQVQLIHSVQQHEFCEELGLLKLKKPVSKSSALYKLDPRLGEDGSLRVGGRLQWSRLSFEERHPIILPKSHLALLVVRFYHRLLRHAGVDTMITAVRNKFWVIGLRRLAKQVKRECFMCQRLDAHPYDQPMAPLPGDRVRQAPPFSVTGMDHAGPLYCCDELENKFYILLFTCAVVRAVHLELVNSLSVEDTMLALRRLAARRGLPSTIYSDNAKTFVGVQHQLVRYFGSSSPNWKFIAPRSPWWGGWWERLVRSVKAALRKSVGTRSLTRTELETVLHEVEACVNSRPLTFVGDGPDSKTPLTPSHFLIGRTAGFQPDGEEGPFVVNVESLSGREELRQQLLNRFWTLWSDEYVRNLPPWRGTQVRGKPQEGSVVIIHEEGYPRLHWPIGVVTQVHPSKDGAVRAVTVRTNKGFLTRSIQRVHDLELVAADLPEPLQNSNIPPTEETDEDVASDPQNQPEPVTISPEKPKLVDKGGQQLTAEPQHRVSRCGRVIRARPKLDL